MRFLSFYTDEWGVMENIGELHCLHFNIILFFVKISKIKFWIGNIFIFSLWLQFLCLISVLGKKWFYFLKLLTICTLLFHYYGKIIYYGNSILGDYKQKDFVEIPFIHYHYFILFYMNLEIPDLILHCRSFTIILHVDLWLAYFYGASVSQTLILFRKKSHPYIFGAFFYTWIFFFLFILWFYKHKFLLHSYVL